MSKKSNEKLKYLETESKLIMDQIKAEATNSREINNYIESEKKKYKKSDEIEDLNHYGEAEH